MEAKDEHPHHQGRELARWKMKTTEWFKTYLEIEEECPIQEPEFFFVFFKLFSMLATKI